MDFKKDWNWYLVIICSAMLIGIFITQAIYEGWYYKFPYSLAFKIHGYTKENALSICSGENLERTCYCLNSFVRGIYKYNRTSDKIKLSFEELVERGGDCLDWQRLTCELGRRLGFKCTKVTIPIEEIRDVLYKHTWTVLSSSEGYCELDLNGMDYYGFKN